MTPPLAHVSDSREKLLAEHLSAKGYPEVSGGLLTPQGTAYSQ